MKHLQHKQSLCHMKNSQEKLKNKGKNGLSTSQRKLLQLFGTTLMMIVMEVLIRKNPSTLSNHLCKIRKCMFRRMCHKLNLTKIFSPFVLLHTTWMVTKILILRSYKNL